MRSENYSVLVYGQFPPPYHGSNIMTQTFIQSLSNLGIPAGLSPKLFSRKIEEVNKIGPVKFVRFFLTFVRFAARIIIHRPHLVVFFISASKVGIIADGLHVLLARLLGIPTVLYLQGRGHGVLYADSVIFRKVISVVFNSSRACIVLGDRLQKETSRFYGGEIFVLPNCLEDTSSVKTNSDDNIIRVLFLSNINEGKGILTVMSALPLVIAQCPGIRFIIAGAWQDPILKRTVLRLIRDEGLGKYVRFLGPVFGLQKERLFSQCDMFVFPTHYQFETFGLVVLEAMRAGLPVIASNVASLPEIVVDGVTGYIIPPREYRPLARRVAALAKDPARRRRMGERGRARFKSDFSLSAYELRLKTIMDRIMYSK